MLKEPFFAQIEDGKIKYGLESLEDYRDGDQIMVVPMEIYDLMIDDLARMEIKLFKIGEALESEELYMREIDELTELKNRLNKIRLVLEESE